MSHQPRILIVKLSAIGDCLHATPALAALRQTFPNAHLGWAVHAHCAPVITSNSNLDKVHRWDRLRMLEEFVVLRKSLRRERYDIALDLQGLFKSGFVTKLSGANKRFGPSEAREFAQVFYTSKIASQKGQHIIDVYLNRAKAVGAQWESPPPMLFPVSSRDAEYADFLLREPGISLDRPIIVLNPSAGKPFKQWAPECFGRLADSLVSELGAYCLVTGSPGDRPLGEAVMAHTQYKDQVFNVVGRTSLTQLAGLLSKVSLFIGGDTGPMHMAQAVGTRVLALFGPTDPARLGPRDTDHRVIYRPGDDPMRSMHNITVEEVFHEAKGMVDGRASGVS
ncbi:MAG: glycosyltransferase family 9 protein [Chthonomonas sp.]|nr:glycosyltransferase family 9 protein [Chthonomonas sp.]